MRLLWKSDGRVRGSTHSSRGPGPLPLLTTVNVILLTDLRGKKSVSGEPLIVSHNLGREVLPRPPRSRLRIFSLTFLIIISIPVRASVAGRRTLSELLGRPTLRDDCRSERRFGP